MLVKVDRPPRSGQASLDARGAATTFHRKPEREERRFILPDEGILSLILVLRYTPFRNSSPKKHAAQPPSRPRARALEPDPVPGDGVQLNGPGDRAQEAPSQANQRWLSSVLQHRRRARRLPTTRAAAARVTSCGSPKSRLSMVISVVCFVW